MTTSTSSPLKMTEASASKHESAQSRLMSGVALACVVLLLVRATEHAAAPLSNGDTWFHLRIGNEFWGEWALTAPGSLSTFAREEWVPTQWSTQMLAAWMESRFGLPGVAWLFGVLYLVFVVVTYRVLRSHGAVLPTALATGVVFVAAGSSLSARPQVVSLILFVLTVGVWLRVFDSGRPPWFLIPVTWGWATAHGLWTAGVLLGVVVCVGLLLDRRVSGRQAIAVFAVPALSLAVAALTPVGPKLLLSQLAVGERSALITEWGPTSFRETPPIVAALFVAALIALWSRRGSRIEWTPLLMLMLASAWILTVERMVAFGVIAVAPLLVRALSDVMRQPRPSARQIRTETVALSSAAVACAVFLAFVAPRTAVAPADVPHDFSVALADLPDHSSVLVEDHIGSWIEWKFPHLSPVVDGMFDAYSVAYLEEFRAFKGLEPGWTTFVEDSHASVAVLRERSPVTTAIQSQLGWQAVRHDGGWVYLTAPTE